ncbi:MAG TPA: Tex family protein [Candidatus Limiplasma sp.]|nr:Tex family protein [Candidatus Limiplasma sp.]HPS80313.1 Tex family protein [Candidatus Limiplasma sp.]
MDILNLLCKEFHLQATQCQNVIGLIDDGNTIPFIARYRKEMTGSMDDQLLREVYERLQYLRSLDKRREEIQKSMTEQNVLTDELAAKLASAATLAELEDLYRPFRPKRRTRATIAKEKGLEPLALTLLMQNEKKITLAELAAPFLSEEKGVATADEALQGARDIIAEQMSDDADVRKATRALAFRSGVMVTAKAKDEDSVYSMYYDFKQDVRTLPGHRILAINRGEREEFLKTVVQMDDSGSLSILEKAFVREGSVTTEQVRLAAQDAWQRLIEPSIEREVRAELTDKASAAAIQVFGKNLHQLLMAPPIKGRVTLGVDPGFRTGCKLAVVDENGKVLATGVGHFTLPGMEAGKARAKADILAMCKTYGVTAIAIGNGTASREAEQFIVSLLPELAKGTAYMLVSEAGASVYSASKLAAEEFPQYDVSLRSAVSIARRMQDPLAELVKIDPKAIGVGQYQHDLKENELNEALGGVVEGCVNSVGVEVSTASPSLLSHVAGIGPALAKNIVAYREENGIQSRAELKKVPKLGPKAFEQCAGFIRVADSKNVLDATAVHPESYDAAKALLLALGYNMADVRAGKLADLQQRADEKGLRALAAELNVGEPTLKDIVRELQKPGRDPRDDLPKPILRTDVLDIKDLQPGMELMGTVRNVIDFGAFVDIGVHQDGLVHISRIANRYIKHPSEVLKVGDIVKVWVVEVDVKKQRIALTMLPPKA